MVKHSPLLNKVTCYISVIFRFISEVTLSVCDPLNYVNKLITKRWLSLCCTSCKIFTLANHWPS